MSDARTAIACVLAALALLAAPAAAFGAESQDRTSIDGAAEALRNELEPAMPSFETLQEQRAENGRDIGNARVQGLQDVMYDGNEMRPTITLKLDDATLVEGTDFDVTFTGDIVDPGDVAVTITGKGSYTGSIETGFTILPGDLAYATVDVIPNQEATGEPLMPAPHVELEGKTLVEGVDYLVSYTDNIDKGTAGMTITGIGNCTGLKHASFEVLEAPETSVFQDEFAAALPLIVGPALVAAVALGIVAFTLMRKKTPGAR